MAELGFEDNFVDIKFIKRVLGFDSVRRIQQLTQDGVLNTCEVKEGSRKVKRYDLFPTILTYIGYLKTKSAGKYSNEKEQKTSEKMQAEID